MDLSVFPELEEGDYYWHDLIGCSVVNLEGYTMGTVTEMMETGSNDVLVVKANTKDAFGKQERLIPFLYEQVVKRVDLTTKNNRSGLGRWFLISSMHKRNVVGFLCG